MSEPKPVKFWTMDEEAPTFEITFVNKTARVLGTCTGRRLLMGQNKLQLNKEELTLIMQDPGFRSWQQQGWVSVSQPPVDAPAKEEEPQAPEELEDLTSILVMDAKELVAACGDIETLAKWHDADKRPTLKDLIMERIQVLDPDLEVEDAEEE